jgi:hypothetical protein
MKYHFALCGIPLFDLGGVHGFGSLCAIIK